MKDAEVWPRPYQQPIRVWHGSATSKESVDLAARYGDPLFSANVTNPIEPYAELIRYYRERWEHYGHDPADIAVGAGTAGLYVAPTTQERAGRLPADLREQPRLPEAGGPAHRLRDPGGLRRAQLRADRQPAADHRQGAPLPRAVRAHRAPSARGRQWLDGSSAP
ncbi:LLM class flavin-dependent oxidoreductase [Streptomyces sp. L7]